MLVAISADADEEAFNTCLDIGFDFVASTPLSQEFLKKVFTEITNRSNLYSQASQRMSSEQLRRLYAQEQLSNIIE